MLPKVVFTDIDGVWTDGGMYYDEMGGEFKKFNTSDSAGVLFLHINDIPIVILTGENSSAVLHRAKKLKIREVFVAVKNKLEKATKWLSERNISLSEAAFIGDDLNDMELLRAVGISACPNQAPDYVKNCVGHILHKKGGEGAFREFVEMLLKNEGELENTLKKWTEQV